MELRSRGVSTYLQTFVLISVALTGSFAVYRAVASYPSLASGPGVAVTNAMARQGSNFAIERLTVSNVGSIAFTSFTILNVGLSSGLTYCYSLWNPATQSSLGASCPSMASNPGTVQFSLAVPSGSSVVVQLTIAGGNAFALGKSYLVVVSCSPAAQASLKVVAVPG
ncbi:MAG: hypothetical protein HY297_03785 [Thaumarchaeota archaeon]|nr:hypothetical protein [Nitrososphaerota archaeon]